MGIIRMEMLGIDAADSENIATTIDSDRTGRITLEKFVHGCMRLRGSARKSDISVIMSEIRRLHKDVAELCMKSNSKAATMTFNPSADWQAHSADVHLGPWNWKTVFLWMF